MSGGWPRRPGLTAFGPKMQNVRPVRNPQTDPDANVLNLYRFQVAGMGLVCCRAFASIDTSGSATLVNHGEVWNSDGSQPAPVLARTGTGVVTLTYLATYPDDTGEAQAFSITDVAGVQSSSANVRHVAPTWSGLVITARLKEFSGGSFSAVDGRLILFIL